MTEENKQTEQQPAPEDKPKETLEDLYSQYSVNEPAPQTAVHPTEPQPAENLDTATQPNLAAFMQELARDRAERAQEREERMRKADEADFRDAVATLGKNAELQGKDKMLRGYLISKASEDSRLRALWENRKENPTAWNRALKIMSDEVKEEFVVPNPQLEENQRAMEVSQQSASSSAPPKPKQEEEVMRMNPAEFEQFWRRLAR